MKKFNKLLLIPFILSSLVACGEQTTSSSISLSNSVNNPISSSSLTTSSVSSTISSNSTTSSSQENIYENLSLEILKDDTVVSELNVVAGDIIQLNATNNKNANIELVWNSSNASIATVSENGELKALSSGTTVVSVKAKEAPYIKKSIFVNVKDKVEQLGVGSGSSLNDPIFLGNEGKDQPLEIYFLEMGQIYSDSIYIKKGNVDILIDAGYEYDGKYVSEFLAEKMQDDRLDLLMFSHSDGDHIDGSTEALKNIQDISLMVDYGGLATGKVGNIRNNYTKKGMVYHSAYDCQKMLNGAYSRYYLTNEFYFEILNTGNYIQNTDTGAGNAESVAVIFYYKDFKFFTAGDLTTQYEKQLVKNESLPNVTLFKAAHHGSNGSNSTEILEALNPKAVAISAARAGKYGQTPSLSETNTYNLDAKTGHPYEDAIKRIYEAPYISQNLNVYWNAVNGTMKFTTYGEDSFEFEGSPTRKGYYDLTLTNNQAVWNDELQDFENKVTGEENKRLHETKAFIFRDYIQYLPAWAIKEYFPDYN